MSPPGNKPDKEPLARSLGKFFGHLARGFTEDVEQGASKHEVSRTVEEEQTEDEQGRKVTMRRTTIEEIEVRDQRDA